MASLGSEDDLRAALSSVLLQDDTAEGIDEDLVEYLAGLLAEAEIGASDLGPLLGVDGSAGPDQDLLEGSPVYELMGPFLESGGCDGRTVGRAVAAVHDLALSGGAGGGSGREAEAGRREVELHRARPPTRPAASGRGWCPSRLS